VGGVAGVDSELLRINDWLAAACRVVPTAEHGGDERLIVYRCGGH
jgi:hypothetical protein